MFFNQINGFHLSDRDKLTTLLCWPNRSIFTLQMSIIKQLDLQGATTVLSLNLKQHNEHLWALKRLLRDKAICSSSTSLHSESKEWRQSKIWWQQASNMLFFGDIVWHWTAPKSQTFHHKQKYMFLAIQMAANHFVPRWRFCTARRNMKGGIQQSIFVLIWRCDLTNWTKEQHAFSDSQQNFSWVVKSLSADRWKWWKQRKTRFAGWVVQFSEKTCSPTNILCDLRSLHEHCPKSKPNFSPLTGLATQRLQVFSASRTFLNLISEQKEMWRVQASVASIKINRNNQSFLAWKWPFKKSTSIQFRYFTTTHWNCSTNIKIVKHTMVLPTMWWIRRKCDEECSWKVTRPFGYNWKIYVSNSSWLLDFVKQISPSLGQQISWRQLSLTRTNKGASQHPGEAFSVCPEQSLTRWT